MSASALADLSVLECGTRLSVGMCGKLFKDLGAQVTKVEPIGGDPSRRAGPFPADVVDPEQSGLFAYLHGGKHSVTIDLETDAGRTALRQLAAGFDIVIAGGSYAELERWGLLQEQLSEVNPRLICTAITPFGLTGPRRDAMDSEIVVTALSGVGNYVPGPLTSPTHSPVKPGTHTIDFCAGVQAANATMVALNGLRANGVGAQVDVSEQEGLLDSLRYFLSIYAYEDTVQRRGAPRDISGKCLDGYVNGLPSALSEDRVWLALVDAMGNPEWAMDPELFDYALRQTHAAEVNARIDAWTATMRASEVTQLMQDRHVPVLFAKSVDELLVDEQLLSRNYFMTLAHPGLEQARVPASPIRFDGGPSSGPGRAPFLGEHNHEALHGAGFSDDRIAWLDRSNVI